MNFVALIGIVETINNKESDKYNIVLKVEKREVEDTTKENWYDIVNVTITRKDIDNYDDIEKHLQCGDIIGIKGRLDSNSITIAERIQIF